MLETQEQLIAAAKARGLDLKAIRTGLDASGLDFFALHAEDAAGMPWIVKTPRHAKAYEGAVNEARMLEVVKARLPVAVPDWRVFDETIIAYPRLAGVTAWSYDPEAGLTWNVIDPANPSQTFIDSTAAFLVALHSTPRDVVEKAGGRVKTMEQVRAFVSEAVERTREALAPSERVSSRWQAWLADDSYWQGPTALVHGDFHPGHMLIDEAGKLTGVLDWTEAEVGDPAVDFVIFLGGFGREALDRLVDAYVRYGGRVSERFHEHVAERWAVTPVLAAKWALDHDDAGVLEHAKAQLAGIEAETAD